MTRFDPQFFQPFDFTAAQIRRFWDGVLKDLDIARKDPFPEVCFTYAYQALLKAGIALLAKKGKVKVRSVPSHHIQVLRMLSELLNDKAVFTAANAMRMKRNRDLYDGGGMITAKEAADYLKFVEGVLGKVRKILASGQKTRKGKAE